MKSGIQYVNGISAKEAAECGFNNIELRFEDIKNAGEILSCGCSISGICVSLKEMTESGSGKDGLREDAKQRFAEALEQSVRLGADYIVIETEYVGNETALVQLAEKCLEDIIKAGVNIYIENGFISVEGRFYHSGYSEASLLKKTAVRLNELCARDIFGICINIGHANLLGINIRDMIAESGSMLGLVHINDNDGLRDQHQMPYTFTTGRGILSTDWYHIVGSLFRADFRGSLVFDTKGNMKRTPAQLHRVMLELMRAVIDEWEDSCLKLEDYLSQPGKHIILFGAGKMAQNYMEAWGEKYRPSFLADNNSKLWGTETMGLPVKSPEEILHVPEDERNVWICNQYYDAIGQQLDKMGVKYRCYRDHYFL